MKDLAPLLLCAGAAYFMFAAPSADRPTKEPDTEEKAPVKPATPLDAGMEARWWEALARRVEGCQINTMYMVVQTADQAVEWGDIANSERLSKARTEATMEPFTDEQRAQAAALIRGQ